MFQEIIFVKNETELERTEPLDNFSRANLKQMDHGGISPEFVMVSQTSACPVYHFYIYCFSLRDAFPTAHESGSEGMGMGYRRTAKEAKRLSFRFRCMDLDK